MKENLYQYVDHTALKACTTWEEIRKLCREALKYGMASVCIPSSYVGRAHEAFPELTICTVVGFPLGNANTAGKLAETRQALADGASEIDMVINIGALKEGLYDYVRQEILEVVKTTGRHKGIVKTILETCELKDEEIVKACHLAIEAGAAYIKTSTGFGKAGATPHAVSLIKETVGDKAQIKASGGIRDILTAREMLRLGASRIGCSASAAIMESLK